MIDAALQRKNMVESQIRPSDITDRRIINAISATPREAFLPPALQTIAYADTDLQLSKSGPGRPARGMMAPRTFALLVQLAQISNQDVVLDIGCATGYSAAVLAHIAETVVALETDPDLLEAATTVGRTLSLDNLAFVSGVLSTGYPAEGPYDAIIMEGRVGQVPDALLDQLKDGGRLVAIEAGEGNSQAKVWYRFGESFDQRPAFEAAAPDLPGFEAKKEFQF